MLAACVTATAAWIGPTVGFSSSAAYTHIHRFQSPPIARAKSGGKGFGKPEVKPQPSNGGSGSGGGLPIEVLARRQHTALALRQNWETVSDRLGGLLSGESVQTKTSPSHGVGVFATRQISEGELIALHPVDRVLLQLPGGKVTGALAEEADASYFRPTGPAAGGLSADELAYRQVAYRKAFSHINPQRPERFLLDANPTKPDVKGWLGHRINDGAALSPGASEEAVLEYYEKSGAERNCCAVALCPPLLAFVTTKPVAEGAELLQTYGHHYWLQSAAAASELGLGAEAERGVVAKEKLQALAREADLWQVSVDKKHSQHIAALDEFIEKLGQAEA